MLTAELAGGDDAAPATRLLDGVYASPDVPVPSLAPTAEPVAPLAPEDRRRPGTGTSRRRTSAT